VFRCWESCPSLWCPAARRVAQVFDVRHWECCPSFWCSALGQNRIRAILFSLFPYCCPLLYRLQFLFFRSDSFGVSNVFMAVISVEHGRLPPLLPRRGRETVFHGLALPGVLASALRRTHSPWLQRGSFSLPLPLVHGQRLGRLRDQLDDTS
jgi:hypothetical protein